MLIKCSFFLDNYWVQTIIRPQEKTKIRVLSKNIFNYFFNMSCLRLFFGNPALASKLIIAALHNNNQRIAVSVILRMDIKFVILGLYLTLFWEVKKQTWKSCSFPTWRTKFGWIIWWTASWNVHWSVSWWICSTLVCLLSFEDLRLRLKLQPQKNTKLHPWTN